MKNIKSGVTDLIEMPKQGFVEGPLEGVNGLFQGAGSLAKKTFVGAFNSVQGITDSLATGVS